MCKIKKKFCTEHEAYFEEVIWHCNGYIDTNECDSLDQPANKLKKTKVNTICQPCADEIARLDAEEKLNSMPMPPKNGNDNRSVYTRSSGSSGSRSSTSSGGGYRIVGGKKTIPKRARFLLALSGMSR